MNKAPMGKRKCEDCILFHPERGPQKECSVFGMQQNRTGDCSAYIDKGDEDDGEESPT